MKNNCNTSTEIRFVINTLTITVTIRYTVLAAMLPKDLPGFSLKLVVSSVFHEPMVSLLLNRPELNFNLCSSTSKFMCPILAK